MRYVLDACAIISLIKNEEMILVHMGDRHLLIL